MANTAIKGEALTLENGVPGERLLVTRPAGAALKADQIVNLVMIVKDIETHHSKKASGAIVDRGEDKPDFDTYTVWSVDRFEKMT